MSEGRLMNALAPSGTCTRRIAPPRLPRSRQAARRSRKASGRSGCALEPEPNGLPAGGQIDLWDLDASAPMAWNAERRAVEATLRMRHVTREEKRVMLTRYCREQRLRTYFDPVGACEAVEDEIVRDR